MSSAPDPVSRRSAAVWMVVVVAVSLVVSGILYAILFTAFGTTEGEGDGARRTADDFDRAAGALGGEWEVDAGAWAVDEEGRAAVTEPGGDGTSVAVVDLGDLPGQVSAVAVQPAPGWGLAFRYRSADEHWAAVVGDDGRIHLQVVDGSDVADLGAVGDTRVAPMSRVEVRLVGDAVEVRIDDAYVGRVRDDRMQRATRVGLTLRGDRVGARWDDLVAGPIETPLVVVPPADG